MDQTGKLFKTNMKQLTILLLFLASFCGAQDITPVTVNLRDNSRLQFNGQPVKMKAVVNDYAPIVNKGKEFFLSVTIVYYESVAGSYGNPIIQTINSDGTLTADEKTELGYIYGDRIVEYSTANQYVDASGNVVPRGTVGATTELAYWQTFKLNQVAGVGTVANTGAVDSQYLVLTAIINKLNLRKKW